MLRDPELILERWMRFFSGLRSTRPQHYRRDPAASCRARPWGRADGGRGGLGLAVNGNAKAVGPDELPVELLKLGLHHDTTMLREFHRVITRVWRDGKVPQR